MGKTEQGPDIAFPSGNQRPSDSNHPIQKAHSSASSGAVGQLFLQIGECSGGSKTLIPGSFASHSDRLVLASQRLLTRSDDLGPSLPVKTYDPSTTFDMPS